MKRLTIAVLVCMSNPLLVVRPTVSANNSVVPIVWWATVWPQNQKYVEIKVVVKEGFCLKPVLPFSVAYFNDRGVELGTLKGEFVNKQKEICAGTYVAYYELDYFAKSTGRGAMSWTLTGPRPFSGRAFQKKR